ncbi:MAG: NifB/NifX family molybdenum-iron cluster-binding protein [Bacteroidota bacterium]
MKAAIPTNDGIKMAPSFEQAKGFLILNIELGRVVNEELVWKSISNRLTNPVDNMTLLSGCSAVITEKISEQNIAGLSSNGITLVQSNDSIITNTIVHYLEHEISKAADHCCCP